MPRSSVNPKRLMFREMAGTMLEERRSRDVLAQVQRIHQRMDFRFPPFRFEDFLAVYESYKVFEVDLPLGLDGRIFLTPDGAQRTIYLRKQNARTRVRFTLAHEIMHAELHFKSGQLRTLTACRTSEHYRDGRRNVVEREADLGAAALLMPLWMIDRYVPYRIRREYPDDVVAEMARLFRVSDAAMRIQLKNYSACQGEFPAP
jgi:Zn-dependent peptidase ImmA (M78 family)